MKYEKCTHVVMFISWVFVFQRESFQNSGKNKINIIESIFCGQWVVEKSGFQLELLYSIPIRFLRYVTAY